MRALRILLGILLFWGGVIVPSFVYFGPHFRTPVDPSASMFTLNTNMHGLRVLPVILAVTIAPVLAGANGAWWTVGGGFGGVGLVGGLVVLWKMDSFAQKLDRHRREMVEAFREREPI